MFFEEELNQLLHIENVSEYGIYISILGLIILSIYLALTSKEGKKSRKKKSWKTIKMYEVDGLQNLCEHICDNVSEDLLQKRNKAKKAKRIAIFSIVALWFLSYLVVNVASNVVIIIYLVLSIGITIKVYCDSVKAKQKYKSLYKKEVINTFIKSISPNMQYSENELSHSKIKIDYNCIDFDDVNKEGARTEVEDYFAENTDTVDMEIAEVFSYKRGNNGAGVNSSVVFFRGMFITLNTNKRYEELEIRLNRFKPFDKKQTITIDNQRFNKYFKVHATDDVNWSKILTDDLITFLTDFREKYDIDFEIIFKDKIYIRFYTTNMFEPQMKGKIVDEYSVYQFYVITKFAREFVEKINKN